MKIQITVDRDILYKAAKDHGESEVAFMSSIYERVLENIDSGYKKDKFSNEITGEVALTYEVLQ